ncbi:unnamed protein product [Cylindrotheca closterium]|uniref:Mitogen-activated protein kinase n=1 Tax=Cylindrotheca closterium TaxID=2856 RepID=A0AAD2FUX8_9STRA|nr:unnamed protein product [Cylindrotheca closterium]
MNDASAETPPPTPRELPQKESKRNMNHSDHSAKRLKPSNYQEEGDAPVDDDHRAPEASPQEYRLPPGARTPVTPNTIRTSSLGSTSSVLSSERSMTDRSIPGTPAGTMMDRKPSASPSDISSLASRGPSMSPVTPFVHHELPPAPPSTPASDNHARAMHMFATSPLPYQALKNADQLERQQLLQDGVATPAPNKPAQPPKAKLTSLIDDFSDWAVGTRYKLQRMLGRGSYGEVAQAIDLKQNRADAFVAIKRIQSPFEQEIDSVRLFREIHLLRRLRDHECVIQLLDVVQPPTDDLADFHDLYLVFEYVDTDLYKLIMSPQYLTTEHIQTFLYQMLTGLKFLHSASVIHRDLKPANILLNENCSLKICDFGLARIVDASSMMSSWSKKADGKPDRPPAFPKKSPLTRQLTKHVVTRWYRAPELILIQPYTSAVDIWSLGCIMAELLSMQEGNVPGYQDRTPLFPGGSCYPLSGEGATVNDERLDQLNVIFGVIGTPSTEEIAALGKANEYIKTLEFKKPKNLKELYPASDPIALDLLQQMLKFNPKNRCTAEEALEHKFFQGVRRMELERVAEEALEVPDFLNSADIDLTSLKRKTFEEVIWYRDHQDGIDPKAKSENKGSAAAE